MRAALARFPTRRRAQHPGLELTELPETLLPVTRHIHKQRSQRDLQRLLVTPVPGAARLPERPKHHTGPGAGGSASGTPAPLRAPSSCHLYAPATGTGRETHGLCHAAEVPHQDSPAGEGRGAAGCPQRSSSMGWLPLPLEGFLRPRRKAHCHSAARGAGLADRPERECHARDEGVARVRGQRGVGGGVGWHGPVAQWGRVDVGVEAWGERRVGRLLHRA